jgi:glutamate--cysteine ligase
MPSPTKVLTEPTARRWVAERSFATSGALLGATIQWLTFEEDDDLHRPSLDAMRACFSISPTEAGVVSFEPGGQVEIGTQAGSLPQTISRAAAEVADARERLRGIGVRTVGLGVDPVRPEERVLFAPRYDAMERYFDARGPAGRRMMCGTAAIRINVEAGEPADLRWEVAHAVGPVLSAAFANSPLLRGAPTGWRSTRLSTWRAIDRTRTAPVPSRSGAVEDWIDYVLAANVMLIRVSPSDFRPVLESLPFGRWLSDGHELGYPTEDDLDYHMTTLFPPVRAGGRLELRMVDALPQPFWRVPIAVAGALFENDEASARVVTACEGVRDLWIEAARYGVAHPELGAAAMECFAAATEVLDGSDVDGATKDAVAAFADRYVSRSRCPADDVLVSWMRGRSVLEEDAGLQTIGVA